MRKSLGVVLLAMLAGLTGCLSFSVGRTQKEPTLASEISELKKLQRSGTISAKEFEMGKLALLRQYGSEPPATIDRSDTQLATYPAPAEEVTK